MLWLLQKEQNQFGSVLGNVICSYSAKYFRIHQTVLHIIDRQWPGLCCFIRCCEMRYINKVVLELYTAKLTEKVFEGKQMEHYATATSVTSPGFHLLKTKLKGICLQKLQQRPGSASPQIKFNIWWCLYVPDFRLSLTAKCLHPSTVRFMIVNLSHHSWSLRHTKPIRQIWMSIPRNSSWESLLSSVRLSIGASIHAPLCHSLHFVALACFLAALSVLLNQVCLATVTCWEVNRGGPSFLSFVVC